jgi:hypothetical protein
MKPLSLESKKPTLSNTDLLLHRFNNPLLHRCGQETRVIPRILQMRSHWLKSQKESVRLEEAGLSKEVGNDSTVR